LSQKEQEADSKMESLLDGNKNLQHQLEPFLKFASQRYPGEEQDKALEKLKDDLNIIKTQVAPRILNEEQRKTLIEELRQIEKKKFRIEAVQGDQEAFELAQSLKMTIHEAGYDVDDIALAANIPFRGLRISVGNKPAPECANLIRKILTHAGFNVRDIYEPNQDTDTVNLTIGSKPQ